MQNSAMNAVRDTFDGRRRLRSWRNTHYGGMEAVKAHPLAMCRFNPDEGGTVATNLNIKLAPVSGYMRSKVYVDVVQIFVPYQAIEKLFLDEQEDGGVTEMARRRLMADEGIGLGLDNDIARACNIHPISSGGEGKVSKTVRFGYTCAVNHLRSTAYHAANLADKNNRVILPAVLTANVLDRFNGVLDPERNIDGAINLTGNIPVKGIGRYGTAVPDNIDRSVTETGGDDVYELSGDLSSTNNSDRFAIELDETGRPMVYVDLDGTSEITLRDMVESQKLDMLVRKFARMIKDDPVNGEEKVERALYSLSVDYDHNCQVMFRKVFELTAAHQRPSDGASINEVSAHFALDTQFATVVPRSELGGQLVTLAMIKPVETVSKQPDPHQSEKWRVVNRVHDETSLEEVLITRRDIESGVSANNEDTPTFWVGHGALKHDYSTQGANEQQIQDVELQSSMWIYEIPTSVTPENVNYPFEGVEMYPFYNWNGPHAEYTVSQVAAISTSLAKGPNPIERIQLFDDNPGLIESDAVNEGTINQGIGGLF